MPASSERTSASRYRRWPPRVRMEVSLPALAQRVTVFGSTRNMVATSAGVSRGSASGVRVVIGSAFRRPRWGDIENSRISTTMVPDGPDVRNGHYGLSSAWSVRTTARPPTGQIARISRSVRVLEGGHGGPALDHGAVGE